MKISEMTNDQATEALIRLSVPFGNICDDDETMKLGEKYFKSREELPVIKAIGSALPQITAHLLKTHKEDVYEIIGALTFKSKSEVAKMNFKETLKILKESYDDTLRDFFQSSAARMKGTEER